MKRFLVVLLGLSACALFPDPGPKAFYACSRDGECARGQVCVAHECQPGATDAGDAGPPDAGDAGPDAGPDAGTDAGPDAGPSLTDAGNATLLVTLVSGGPVVSLLSGMDDGNVYAAGHSIWRYSRSSSGIWSFSDRGDLLADAVEEGLQSTQGFRPLTYGEVAGDEFVAVALYTPPTPNTDVGIYVKHGNRWHQIAVLPTLRNWALVDGKGLGPLVYALVASDNDGGAELIRIDEDGGQLNLVAPLDAGWACSDLTGAPDSGTLYVAMTQQNNLYTQGLTIDEVDGGPVITQQFSLGVTPMPNPGGCRHVGPIAFEQGTGNFRGTELLYWDGAYGLASLESIPPSDFGLNNQDFFFDAGPPLALTVARGLDFIVAGASNLLYGETTGVNGPSRPGPFFSVLPDPIQQLASSSERVLALTESGLYDVTTQAAIDGGGVPLPGDTGLDGQVPFGYAASPNALFALGGAERTFPSVYRDTGLGLTPFASPVGEQCGTITPIADDAAFIVCDGGGLWFLDGGAVTEMPAAPGALVATAAVDGGIWLYSQTSPVQVTSSKTVAFQPITATDSPVWASPLNGVLPEAYAFANSGQVVLLNGPGTPTQLGAAPFTTAGTVDANNGYRFAGADAQGVVWMCNVDLLPASLNCQKLCAMPDAVVTLQFEVLVPLLSSRLWILSHASIQSGMELALLPPVGQSHLAEVTGLDLDLGGKLGDPPPACPLIDLAFPDATTPEALIQLAVAPSPHFGALGSIYVQGSRHLMTLSR